MSLLAWALESQYGKGMKTAVGKISYFDHRTGGHARFTAYPETGTAIGLGESRDAAKADLLRKIVKERAPRKPKASGPSVAAMTKALRARGWSRIAFSQSQLDGSWKATAYHKRSDMGAMGDGDTKAAALNWIYNGDDE